MFVRVSQMRYVDLYQEIPLITANSAVFISNHYDHMRCSMDSNLTWST